MAKQTAKRIASTPALDKLLASAPADAAGLVAWVRAAWPTDHTYNYVAEQQPEAVHMAAAPPAVRADVLRLLVAGEPAEDDKQHLCWAGLFGLMLASRPPLAAAEVVSLFDGLKFPHRRPYVLPLAGLATFAEGLPRPVPADVAKALMAFVDRAGGGYDASHVGDSLSRTAKAVGGTDATGVQAGDVWADGAIAELRAMPADRRATWQALLAHAATATTAKPSAAWVKAARPLAAAVAPADFADTLARWFAAVARFRPEVQDETGLTLDYGYDLSVMNVDVLRGLAWAAAGVPGVDVARALAGLCLTALRKVPGVGPRLPALANAAVYALGEMDHPAAVGQLARLSTAVTYGVTKKQVEKACDAAATRLGVTRDDLAEMAVPTCGFGPGGVRVETVAGCRVEQRIDGDAVRTTWTNDKGKPVKSPPAEAKRAGAELLKELKGSAADAEAMLSAQRRRLDGLMAAPAGRPAAVWRERYLDHPLVGTLARRLIWTDGKRSFAVLDGRLVDADDRPVDLADAAAVSLWHPIGRPTDEALAWRAWLERHGVTQPFKQAHREVYVLTDAERATGTYSNRFAGHVLRQHQFHALAEGRGWRDKLRLMVDDTFPPAARDLPAWGLRAEYWVDGVGDDFGGDSTGAGTYLRLSTDQVRFYRADAAANATQSGTGQYTSQAHDAGDGDRNLPVPLDSVPPLAFSEVMRDVDLFVGVASVGNDPTWQDGGPGGRYRAYWQDYSFGELSATAQTRRAVLERLLPRLKIADRCSLADKFLVVRGQRRTYKIHLGSGNILMEPDDQYLCIVPDRSAADPAGVFLPFEGDGTLSVILSKAFLLAADDRIADPTITRQIDGR